MTNQPTLLDSALAYGRAGWPVIPLHPRKKAPLTQSGVKDATLEVELIRKWWSRYPRANIGLAVPAGFVVVDIDSTEARDQLKANGFILPVTCWSRTGNGWHLWYSTGGGEVRNRVGLLPGVDLRGKNGYVVVPPSIHPSGHPYRWGDPLERQRIAKAPAWVLGGQQMTGLGEPSAAPLRFLESRAQTTDNDWLRRLSQPVHEGRRNQSLAEVAGWFFRRFPAKEADRLTQAWATTNLIPPLPAGEVERTIDSIAGLELRRILAGR